MSKLTPEKRLARLQKHHDKTRLANVTSWNEKDGYLSIQITQVERELKFPIFGDYPLMKFLQQEQDLKYLIDREKAESKR